LIMSLSSGQWGAVEGIHPVGWTVDGKEFCIWVEYLGRKLSTTVVSYILEIKAGRVKLAKANGRIETTPFDGLLFFHRTEGVNYKDTIWIDYYGNEKGEVEWWSPKGVYSKSGMKAAEIRDNQVVIWDAQKIVHPEKGRHVQRDSASSEGGRVQRDRNPPGQESAAP